MDSLLFAMIVSRRATVRIAHSALPNAPVVPDRAPRTASLAVRPRTALARGLERLATVVAPRTPASPGQVSCTPAR
jgi:hypothetical protein